jgi:hypothetical protein
MFDKQLSISKLTRGIAALPQSRSATKAAAYRQQSTQRSDLVFDGDDN